MTNSRRPFDATYEAMFGRVLNEVPVETITWRVIASLSLRHVPKYDSNLEDQTPIRKRSRESAPYSSTKRTSLSIARYLIDTASTHKRLSLALRSLKSGESTVFVGPDANCTIDEHLNLVMSLGD